VTRDEISSIIENYKPHPGFFDLSKKPKYLTEKQYAQVLYLQNFIAEENKRKEYYLEPFNRHLWDKLSDLAAKLQQIIFRYWGNAVFETEGIKKGGA